MLLSFSPSSLWLSLFLRWHHWWISPCSEVELLQKHVKQRVRWHHKAPYCRSRASSMFPPSSSLFLSLSLSPSAERERVRERAIAGVGQGLLTVRIWLQCVNCFILKTLKLMPARASGGLLRVRASEFLKVESGRGWRRADTARKRRRIVTTFTEARKNPSIRRHDTAALRLCPR